MHTSQISIYSSHCDKNNQFIFQCRTQLIIFSFSSIIQPLNFSGAYHLLAPRVHIPPSTKLKLAGRLVLAVECQWQGCPHLLSSMHSLLSPFCWRECGWACSGLSSLLREWGNWRMQCLWGWAMEWKEPGSLVLWRVKAILHCST